MIRRLMFFGMVGWVILLGAVVHAQSLGIGRGAGGLGGLSLAGSSNPVKARAGVSAEPLVPGKEASLIVEVTIDRRFHIQSATTFSPYIAARVMPKAVEGITFGRPQYPVSKEIAAPAGVPGPKTLPVYEGKIYIRVPVMAGLEVAAGERMLEVSLTTQACDEKTCLSPTTQHLSIPVKIGVAGDVPKDPNAALSAAADAQAYGPDVVMTPPATIQGETRPSETTAAGANEFAGVTLLSDDGQIALIAARPYQPGNSEELHYPLWEIILFALCGGMILNVMPCVLPVIPLKVLSLVQQAHGNRQIAVMHSLAFSAGVVSLFVVLAVILRTLGLFYGQQFQSPAFIITMALFVVALALSMLGVWTINPPSALYHVDAKLSGHSGYAGSFSNGLMATLLATPCSGPYLGPVLAWALVQPAWLTALALALVGVGMSLPYLILAAFPTLLNKMPRAGRWTELLKQGLGIAMIGVAIYLIQIIPNAQVWPWAMAGAVVVALVCWAWGQIPTFDMERGRIWAIRSVAVVMGLTLGAGLYVLGSRSHRAMGAPRVEGAWQTFNVAILDAALAEGRPVVVDWTANWCPNCHALEALVLSQESVQQAFNESHAVLLKADLSEDNPPVAALNRKLGGEAIPVLAIFSPAEPYKPVVLRDSYTQARVVDEVHKAGNGKSGS